MKKYLSYITALVLVMVTCTGCYSYRDMNRVLFMTMGICDVKNGQIQFFCEVFKAYRGEGEKAGKEQRVEYFGKGQNLSEAARDLRTTVNYPVNYSGNKTFVFSKRLAEQGLNTTLDLLGRDQKPSLRMYMFIYNGEASDLTGVTMEDEEFLGLYLYEMMNSHKYTMGILPNQYYQFVKNLQTGSGINIVPLLEIESIEEEAALTEQDEQQKGAATNQKPGEGSDQEQGGGGQKSAQSSPPQSEAQTRLPYITVQGAAILLKGKMVGDLNTEELEIYNLMTAKVNSGIISIPNPDFENSRASFSVLHNKYKSKVKMESGRIKLDFFTQVRVVLIDAGQGISGDQVAVDKLKAEIETILETRAVALFERMREENIDVFDLKRKLELNNIKLETDDFLKQVDFNIDVNAVIDGLGTFKESYY